MPDSYIILDSDLKEIVRVECRETGKNCIYIQIRKTRIMLYVENDQLKVRLTGKRLKEIKKGGKVPMPESKKPARKSLQDAMDELNNE